MKDMKKYQFLLTDSTGKFSYYYYFEYPGTADPKTRDGIQRAFIKTTLMDFEGRVYADRNKKEERNMNEVVKSFMLKHGIEWDIEREDLVLGGPNNRAKVSMSVRDVDFGNINTKTIENLAVAMVDVLKGSGGGVYSTEIKDVIFNDPATIVFWLDGSKTVVKAKNEPFDPEKGLAMAFSKKFMGNQGNYFNEFKRWLPDYNFDWEHALNLFMEKQAYAVPTGIDGVVNKFNEVPLVNAVSPDELGTAKTYYDEALEKVKEVVKDVEPKRPKFKVGDLIRQKYFPYTAGMIIHIYESLRAAKIIYREGGIEKTKIVDLDACYLIDSKSADTAPEPEVKKTCSNCKHVKPFSNPVCDKCHGYDMFEAMEEKDSCY